MKNYKTWFNQDTITMHRYRQCESIDTLLKISNIRKCVSIIGEGRSCTFVEWAAQTINKSYWAGEYYRQQREKGSAHQSALRALAFKWIRILYRCWQTRTRYDEATYLKALERRGSPLIAKAA